MYHIDEQMAENMEDLRKTGVNGIGLQRAINDLPFPTHNKLLLIMNC